jgi:hypothetical protein
VSERPLLRNQVLRACLLKRRRGCSESWMHMTAYEALRRATPPGRATCPSCSAEQAAANRERRRRRRPAPAPG